MDKPRQSFVSAGYFADPRGRQISQEIIALVRRWKSATEHSRHNAREPDRTPCDTCAHENLYFTM